MSELCEKHGRFPCIPCGLLHYEGCQCTFCVPDMQDIEVLRQEIDRLKNLVAEGVHSCSHLCKRPMCVLRRELEAEREANARLTAEKATMYENMQTMVAASKAIKAEVEKAKSVIMDKDIEIGQLIGNVHRLEKDYNDLIYQVATKFPNESRHETAKRYIQQAENRPSQYSSALEGKQE